MNKNDLLKCKECGMIMEIVSLGKECGVAKPEVEVLEAKTQDAATEKHVPYVEERENGYLVKVGKEAKHPMLEAHYIEFIELIIDGDKLYRKYLNPGDEPEAFFEIAKGKDVVAREYCNIHGLWKNR
ncbi:desulfoferrodoxin family protein [Fusobacterium sp.]|jgi:superoxide reductase|uniref:desulfoferrodoxin family protein n=1 Tax=Fusobacterium sp. TaxID=68766 RepID=UPI001D460220|nr:desulfoferrodoxin family protein [Fusobacterium sp.]MBS5789300.1 desulfoferrodoxin [Fusobacterium sp.]MCF2639119.1 desulfoferrodoxin [Fusobacterium varium]